MQDHSHEQRKKLVISPVQEKELLKQVARVFMIPFNKIRISPNERPEVPPGPAILTDTAAEMIQPGAGPTGTNSAT